MPNLKPLLALSFLVSTNAFAQVPSADDLVKEGLAKARAEHKNVLLDFRASWCPWCRKLDALYEDPRFAGKFKASYVIVPITVVERQELKAKTNRGWEPLMLKLRKHKDQDIPYVAFLDPRGKILTDSYEEYGTSLPNNAGFPQTNPEISAFLKQVRLTGKAFADADIAALKQYFEAVRVKSGNR